jgi:hypothetical protein
VISIRDPATTRSVWIEPPRPGRLARARVASCTDVEEIERLDFHALLPAVSISGSTPTTAAALLAAHGARRAPVKYVHFGGGSGVPIQTAREFEDKFGVPLHGSGA